MLSGSSLIQVTTNLIQVTTSARSTRPRSQSVLAPARAATSHVSLQLIRSRLGRCPLSTYTIVLPHQPDRIECNIAMINKKLTDESQERLSCAADLILEWIDDSELTNTNVLPYGGRSHHIAHVYDERSSLDNKPRV